MKYFSIKAPEYRPLNDYLNSGNRKLFLAGTITGATEEWQEEMTERLKDKFTIFNPKRDNFDVTDPRVEQEQITWESIHLENADIISFWFAKETVAPITLFELGKYCRDRTKKIYIGVDPEYPRKNDVYIQMRLVGYQEPIAKSLNELILRIQREN